ncbi:bifunctional [glutamine synthetase] adenylyltransferase/[glutamine synthetase]-adenylyl-L-tyrosine phosphorylase [Actinomyces sp. B33]|uniref:bifunctional [glutamine synthetase] adenylyltransferase/[glutamine synthetase]-adenylyl-L-tyrosine phosphorylase n=1 Tax=Actinomyces sp. B33 TaxID=2942131 RepID=UPI00234010EF|nr:bifunctional [glutamine synthetase] adenylyltransferase/[glutamine synthetase]-adenylyl-L-tyrosine phosphorylase [Actinomyces sp. B33]MDC4233216.1 bifunctional [glutamine synthetase] adenylyltransferase/[glutamine synthetase]-adenylyl-L-tyrosine phosphorylase [Actinomyces sp. B33]
MPPDPKPLRGAGVVDAGRAAELLDALPGPRPEWIRALGACADPDLALIQALRLSDAAPGATADAASNADPERLRRLVALLGGSRALGDLVIAAPRERLNAVWEDPTDPRPLLLAAVGADPGEPDPIAAPGRSGDDLRRAYRRALIPIAVDDLTAPDVAARMPVVGRRLADLVDAALAAALALARRDIDPGRTARLAVIAMGKTGARELNYISDVDVVYAVEPAPGQDEREAVEIGTRLAAMLTQACSGAGAEPPLWTIDANLRPEGRSGALVRTVESYRSYWDAWAQTWEFQALLKARACAGDARVGRAFEEAAAPYVWSAAGREGFVDSARRMRARVEETIPRRQADRELKLGRGGLRDVEFSVQLLQLVHGRADEELRVRSTLDAIDALSRGGYVARTDAAELADCYRFLRAIEHRAQLPRMRRTHLIPSDPEELRIMGRAVDPRSWSAPGALADEIARVRERVRALHEDLFYRPIISATAGLSPDEARLDEDAARARLAAVGYLDPAGALSHIRALTSGTSRRATIQRHLLPVFISWLADGADPGLGLLNFRALSERIGDSHWYLALLRDSGVAAQRLCRMLPNSKWIADALATRPEAVAWLDRDDDLAPAPVDRLRAEVASLVSRHPDPQDAAARVRAVRSREVARQAMADILDGLRAGRRAISEATDAALEGALAIAEREDARAHGGARAEVALVAMGRYGGRESSYASDADVIAVHRPVAGAREDEALESATAIVTRVKALLGEVTNQMSVLVDLGLRPEGRNGAMSRTCASYADYYGKWASTWERQALVRARRACGPDDLLDSFFAVVEGHCYGSALDEPSARQIRLLKARMESERLPRGIEPSRHVKLGPGGLSDVEWVVQLLQLRHGHDLPELRTPSTLGALSALEAAGLVAGADAAALREAWELASRIRAGNVLTSGRTSGPRLDVLAREAKDLVPLARMLGYPAGRENILEEEWLRAARRSRAVMDRLFWE